MNKDNQLKQWVLGHSVHNDEIDECCPDFSCCNDTMNTPTETRERFAKAVKDEDEGTKNEMLGLFLGEAISKHVPNKKKKVYIAGLETPENEH